MMDWLVERLTDSRDPNRVTYSLAELVQAHLLLMGQGWRDQDDADRLREDPALRVAHASSRGQTPLDDGHVLASQPTLSRLVDNISRPWVDPDRPPALTDTGVYRNNETLFLMNVLAYQFLHTGRSVMERATGQGWSLRRFRERLLRAAARVVKKGRRLTFAVAWSVAEDWQKLWRQLQRHRWVPG